MEENPVTRPYLESLSRGELARLADSLGVDIPPGLDRLFIIGELLESAAEDEASGDDENSPEAFPVRDNFAGPDALPRIYNITYNITYYNITYIEVMIRDPLWAFVFWEVRSGDREIFENDPDFEGYYLKVSPGGVREPAVREKLSPENAEKAGVFFVPVGPGDSAWYLGFPSEDGSAGGRKKSYKVELCAARAGEELLLTASEPFVLPDLPDRSVAAGGDGGLAGANPLIRLSGAGDFPILSNRDRLPRMKRYGKTAAK
jgi:hypothetical protein